MIFLIMSARGLPRQGLLRELQSPPFSFFSSPDPARAVKHQVREAVLCLSSFGDSLGFFPEHLFIVRGFLLPALLGGWILSMYWEILQDALGQEGRREGDGEKWLQPTGGNVW